MADADPVKKNASRRTGKPENLTNAGKGRPPGAVNKTTALLKDAILIAATKAGGKGGMAGYLQEQAIANPGPFMALLQRVEADGLDASFGQGLADMAADVAGAAGYQDRPRDGMLEHVLLIRLLEQGCYKRAPRRSITTFCE